MGESFNLPGGWIASEAEVSDVFGNGRAEFPLLQVALRMDFNGPKNAGTSIDFKEIRCRVSPFDQSYFAESRPCFLSYRLAGGEKLANQLVYLEIPLDQARIALLNRLRNGGDVKLRLDCELFSDELVEMARLQKENPNTAIWGVKARHRMLHNVEAHIPRSRWIEQVLPNTGFGKVYLLELPVIPIEASLGMHGAFSALEQASKLERHGFYDEAVAKCRLALEPFFDRVDKANERGEIRKVPTLKASWQTRLGKATYEWLNAALIAAKQATDEPHHLSSSSFGQMEAQMVLLVASSLVAYAVKTKPEDQK